MDSMPGAGYPVRFVVTNQFDFYSFINLIKDQNNLIYLLTEILNVPNLVAYFARFDNCEFV